LTSPTTVVAAAGPTASNPQGAHHRRLQLQWWLLPDLPPATARGPAIDVSKFSGGHCRTYRQHPPGGLPSTSSTSVVAIAGPTANTPHGARRRRFAKVGTCHKNFSGDTYQGATAVNITTTRKATSQESEGKSFGENFLGPYGAKNQGIILPLQKLSKNQQTGYDIINYWNNRKRRKSCSWAECLRVLRLTLEPLCYRAGSILNAVPGSLRRPFDGPLHHRLQGDAGVTAPKAH
jgi:hypothetical protein